MLSCRDIAWDLANCKPAILSAFHHLKDAERRDIINHYLNIYDSSVTPVVLKLRKSVIHSDPNDWNVLGDVTSMACTGIIDFGDCVFSHTVNNIAIAIAYIMLKKENPLDIASSILKAYHKTFPLEDVELQLVLILACMRLCVSAVLGAQAIALVL